MIPTEEPQGTPPIPCLLWHFSSFGSSTIYDSKGINEKVGIETVNWIRKEGLDS